MAPELGWIAETSLAADRMESAQPPVSRRRFSLKVTLAGAILATVSATAALVHLPWLLTSRANIDEVVTQVNDEIARSTSQEISNIFDNAHVAQQTIVAAFRRDLADINDPEQRASLYLSLMRANPSFAWLVLGFPNGDQLGVQRVNADTINLLNRRWDAEQQLVRRTVETLALEDERFYSVNVTVDEQDFRVQERPWYRAGAEQPGQPVWTDVYVFATDKVPGINSSLGYERDGEFLGTISVAFELQRISRFLRDLQGDRVSAIFITNQAGELIAFSDLDEATYLMSANEDLRLKQLSESEHPHLQIVSETLAERDADLAQLEQRQDFIHRAPDSGDTHYISLTPLPYEGLDWIVGTTIAESIYLEDIRRNNRWLYVTVSGFIVLAAGLAVWLSGRAIAQPLLRIAEAASAIEAGRFSEVDLKTTSRRRDELGQLARVFQGMSDEVFAREQRLKQQVQELKIEIDESKRREQVSEIVESDFFQDLQSKARAIRRQRRDRQSD